MLEENCCENMKVQSLLWELSSENRLSIIRMLERSPKGLTELSNDLDLPSMETKKQLDNMIMLDIIENEIGEEYRITSVGWAALELIKALEHVTARSDYYKRHDLRSLPTGLIRQIDHLDGTEILANSEQGGDVIVKRQGRVNRFCWVYADFIPPFLVPILSNMLDRSVSINIVSSNESIREVRAKLIGHKNQQIEYRATKKATAFLLVNDDFAILGLPRVFGGIDLNMPIMGDLPQFRSWCESLFHVFWKQGTLISAPVRI